MTISLQRAQTNTAILLISRNGTVRNLWKEKWLFYTPVSCAIQHYHPVQSANTTQCFRTHIPNLLTGIESSAQIMIPAFLANRIEEKSPLTKFQKTITGWNWLPLLTWMVCKPSWTLQPNIGVSSLKNLHLCSKGSLDRRPICIACGNSLERRHTCITSKL